MARPDQLPDKGTFDFSGAHDVVSMKKLSARVKSAVEISTDRIRGVMERSDFAGSRLSGLVFEEDTLNPVFRFSKRAWLAAVGGADFKLAFRAELVGEPPTDLVVKWTPDRTETYPVFNPLDVKMGAWGNFVSALDSQRRKGVILFEHPVTVKGLPRSIRSLGPDLNFVGPDRVRELNDRVGVHEVIASNLLRGAGLLPKSQLDR